VVTPGTVRRDPPSGTAGLHQPAAACGGLRDCGVRSQDLLDQFRLTTWLTGSRDAGHAVGSRGVDLDFPSRDGVLLGAGVQGDLGAVEVTRK
jgi:hypothetical protein